MIQNNVSEGIKGMALLGGAVLAVGGIVGLGLALAKGKKWMSSYMLIFAFANIPPFIGSHNIHNVLKIYLILFICKLYLCCFCYGPA